MHRRTINLSLRHSCEGCPFSGLAVLSRGGKGPSGHDLTLARSKADFFRRCLDYVTTQDTNHVVVATFHLNNFNELCSFDWHLFTNQRLHSITTFPDVYFYVTGKQQKISENPQRTVHDLSLSSVQPRLHRTSSAHNANLCVTSSQTLDKLSTSICAVLCCNVLSIN